MDAMHSGGSSPLVFNAVNEVAVEAFLSNRIGFNAISTIIDKTLNLFDFRHACTMEELLLLDQEARSLADKEISQFV